MAKYLSIDTETTGLNASKCDLLEIGIVVFDSLDYFKPTAENSLRIVLCKEEIKGTIFAINMNINLLNEINEYSKRFKEEKIEGGIIKKVEKDLTTLYVDAKSSFDTLDYPNRIAFDSLSMMISQFLQNAEVEPTYNIAGKNFAGFDKNFLAKYYQLERTILDKASHKVLDVGSMYVDPIKDECLPSLDECLERAGLSEEVPHTAVADAILVVKAVQAKWGVERKVPSTDGGMGRIQNYLDNK